MEKCSVCGKNYDAQETKRLLEYLQTAAQALQEPPTGTENLCPVCIISMLAHSIVYATIAQMSDYQTKPTLENCADCQSEYAPRDTFELVRAFVSRVKPGIDPPQDLSQLLARCPTCSYKLLVRSQSLEIALDLMLRFVRSQAEQAIKSLNAVCQLLGTVFEV